MKFFEKIYTETLTEKGNISYKAIKVSELADTPKALKKTLESIWETTIDVAHHPEHTLKASKLEGMWESAFESYCVLANPAFNTEGFEFNFFQRQILMGTLSVSIKTGENTARFISKATFLKRFIRIADLISEGEISFYNKQSASAEAKASKEEAKLSEKKHIDFKNTVSKAILDMALSGTISYDEYVARMTAIELPYMNNEQFAETFKRNSAKNA